MIMARIAALMFCALAFLAGPALADGALMSALFQDHAVLQRGTPIRVWGHAAPGAKITLSLADATAEATTDASGNWSASLPAMTAGGPYTLTAHSDAGASQTASDILIGDVYLCSGQSNMQLQVRYTLNAYGNIHDSANDTIRMLTVPDRTSATPLADIADPVGWQIAGPSTTGDFSAACYYFANELQKDVHVPLGLIHSSWGGSNIRTWMSDAALRAQGGLDARLDVLALYAKDRAAGTKRWGEMWEDWWLKRVPTQQGEEPWSASLNDSDWATAPADMGYWTDWNVPDLAHFVGAMWYRTSVTLTAAQAAEASKLSLGTLNEEDETWVDGTLIGNTFGYGSPRSYDLPAGTFHEGENSIVVNVLCTYRGCGMFGPSQARAIAFADGSAVPLAGPWRYRKVPNDIGPVPRGPWGAVAGLGMAYNGMIAPLHDLPLHGVLWYQGESNTAEPETYRSLLSGMMMDWRRQFAADLPFLIVQLPNYGPPAIAPQDSGWARVREAEREAVAGDDNAALAVTIDIGAPSDIHPSDKEDVGARLARAARALIYGEPVAPGGPIAVDARRESGAVAIRYKDAEGGLVAYGNADPIGFELCAVDQSSCRYASAHIKGDEVWLDVPKGFLPTHVRDGWADSPVCTLFDGARLPAAPFDLQLTAAQPPKPLPVHTTKHVRRTSHVRAPTSKHGVAHKPASHRHHTKKH
jgi:sialate O-acetylesterase